MNEKDVREAVKQIRHALAHSPLAADTAEGIHTFWLKWAEPRPHWTVTEKALLKLERRGEVERVRLEGGREMWRKAAKS